MIKNSLILIVDDDEELCKMLNVLLKREGYNTLIAHEGQTALQILTEKNPDLLLLDVHLPKMNGLEVLQRMNNNIPVVMITGYANCPTAVKAIKQGAYDYVAKPFKHAQIKRIINNALISQPPQICQIDFDRSELKEKMGNSDVVNKIIKEVNCVASSNFTVLIQGETGVGKELVARAIHESSSRAHGPFIPVDCGAIPETLLESELFGYEKGAFTGAQQKKQGKFEIARGGTLFLDEITNLPLVSQAKLLRVLQEKVCYPLGSVKPVHTNIRILAACNENIKAKVSEGSFRQDLFYRLNEFNLKIPPLRKRSKDIPYLANRFLEMTNKELNKQVQTFSNAANNALLAYSWPGNVREFRAVIRRAVLLADDIIDCKHLAINLTSELEDKKTSTLIEEGLSLKEIVRRQTMMLERQILSQTLKTTQGNKAKAARILQIDYKTIHTKLKQFAIEEKKS